MGTASKSSDSGPDQSVGGGRRSVQPVVWAVAQGAHDNRGSGTCHGAGDRPRGPRGGVPGSGNRGVRRAGRPKKATSRWL